MFKKKLELTIVTRFKNEDILKVERLISTYREPNTMVSETVINKEQVEITFVTAKSCIKGFKKDLNLLTFVGIEAEIK